MNCNFNTFALSKKFILVENVVRTENAPLVEAVKNLDCEAMRIPLLVQYTLMQYGKSLTTDAFVSLCNSTLHVQETIARDVEDYLRELFGNYGSFDSLFGDYPNTVLNMSEFEMAIHTLAQYWTNGAYFPKDYNITEGMDSENSKIDWNLCIKDKYDMIDVCDYQGLGEIYKRIITANQSIITFDKEAIKHLAERINEPTIDPRVAKVMNVVDAIEDIPFKETLCMMIDNFGFEPKTVTDVLRYAVYLSGGDVMLPTIPKTVSDGWSERLITKEEKKAYHYKRFTRAERKRLLEMLNKCMLKLNNNVEEDMKRHIERWLRLGECIHPMEYRNKYPMAAKVFSKLRNNAKAIKTWNSRVEEAKQNFDLEGLMKQLSQKPGEFARTLDNLFRLFGEEEYILEMFEKKIDRVSTKLLYEVSEHFFGRSEKQPRFVSVKGSRKPTELSMLNPLSESFVGKIMSMFISELVRRNNKKETLEGKTVFISSLLENIATPKNMRSVNIGNRIVSRGTRIPLPSDKDLIRFYCHWIDSTGREDLDLSAMFVGDRNRKEYIDWQGNFKLENEVAIFSGDVRHHQGNCAEYIDISISKAIEHGWKYVVVSVHDYDGKTFNCPSYAGFMARDSWGTKGEKTWSPATVENEFRLTSHCENVVMGIIDLENREWIAVDEDLNGIPVANNSKHKNFYASLVERYKREAFWNALKIVTLNLVSRKADIKFATEAEVIARKTETEQILANLQTEKAKAIEAAKGEGKSYDETTETIRQIDKLYAERATFFKQFQFVTFDDIMNDYSVLIEYMS